MCIQDFTEMCILSIDLGKSQTLEIDVTTIMTYYCPNIFLGQKELINSIFKNVKIDKLGLKPLRPFLI